MAEVERVENFQGGLHFDFEGDCVGVGVFEAARKGEVQRLIVAAFGRRCWRAVFASVVGFDRAGRRAAVAVLQVAVVASQSKENPIATYFLTRI